MGLKQTIQQAVNVGLDGLDDLLETVRYRSAGIPGYNATSGAVTVPIEALAPRALFTSYRRQEIDGQLIRPEDQKCLIAVTELEATPTLNDTIEREDGTRWAVVQVRKDPADALWILQVRRP